jgi:hypothetical protein
MNKSIMWNLLAILLSLCAVAESVNCLDDKYLDLSLINDPEFEMEPDLFPKGITALKKIKIEDEKDFSQIREQAIEQVGVENRNRGVRSLFQALARQPNGQENCKHLVEGWLRVCSVIMADTSLHKLLAYLQQHDTGALGRCAMKAKEEFDQALARGRETIETDADEFFKAVLGGAKTDTEMFRAASELNLEQILQTPAKLDRLRTLARTNQKTNKLENFFHRSCLRVHSRHEKLFEALNVAQALGISVLQADQSKLLKCNEFYRFVCVEARRPRLMAMIRETGGPSIIEAVRDKVGTSVKHINYAFKEAKSSTRADSIF